MAWVKVESKSLNEYSFSSLVTGAGQCARERSGSQRKHGTSGGMNMLPRRCALVPCAARGDNHGYNNHYIRRVRARWKNT